jgi:hypothetical protein
MLARRIIYTILGLLVLGTAFYVVGVLAPATYEGEREVTFVDRSYDIWKNLTSLETIPDRKPDVERVEQISESYEAVTWREYLKNGDVRLYRVLEREAPNHFKVELFQSDDGITGVWTYDLYEIQNYTVVRIHETSLNQNVWKRAWHTLLGRSILLRREEKALRVSLFDRLIYTP